jgi:trigger factor
MSVQIEEVSPCRRKLNIEVSADTISKEFDEAISVYASQVALPGFRPGKAPKQLVKSRYQKEITGRLRDHLLPKSYHEALQENDLKVVSILEMDEDIKVKEGEAMSYSVTVDIRPDISLPEYKGISLKRDVEEVKDEELQERIDGLREQRADFEDVDDRPIARGDMAQIDFTGKLDGTDLEEAVPEAKGLGEGKDFWLQASDEAFIPELGLALAGLSIGDQESIPVTFDDTFVVEQLRGTSVTFEVTVKAVRARTLPEMNEAFFEGFGVKDEAEFKERIKESLVSEKEREADGKLRQDIEALLLENTTFDLPESMVAEASQHQIQRIADDLQRQGQGEEDVMEKKDEILETANKAAERQVKLRLVLQTIADQEEIQVDDSELDREVSMLAYAYSMQPDDLKKRMKENNQIEDLRGDVICRKVVDFIKENAEIDGVAKQEDDA